MSDNKDQVDYVHPTTGELDLIRISKERRPEVDKIVHKEFFREDVLSLLKDKNNCVGIELGVAGGIFSKRMVESGKFSKFFGVDLYDDHHNVTEYKRALKYIGLDKNYVLLRMAFDDAYDLFDDHFFDFIYFDGYAHTGEEGGKTFSDWYSKLKVGGVFAGDDYHEGWPLVVWAVNHLVAQVGSELHITGMNETNQLNQYPSWFFVKNADHNVIPSKELLEMELKVAKSSKRANKKVDLSIEDIQKLLLQIKQDFPEVAANLKKLI
jgi:hypothetical protein